MKVDIISSRAAFAAIQDEWDALPQAQQSPLARHEWFASALAAFSEDDELALFVAREGGELRAAAPLVADRSTGSLRFNIIGHQTHEPTSFLYTDEDALAAVCDSIMHSGRSVVMPRIALDSPELRLLGQYRGHGPLRMRPEPMQTSRLALTSFKALEAAMTSANRTKLRQRRKRAESAGPMTVERIVPDETNLKQCLDELFRIEGAGWKAQAGTAMLTDPAMQCFYTLYARAAMERGTLRFYFLRIGEQIVAVRLAVAHGGKLWDLKIGYVEEWRNCAPGILLTHETLRLACEEGLTGFEFLGIAEEWQRRWPIESWQHTTLRYYPMSLNGGLSLGVDVYRFGGERVKAAFAREKEMQAAH